MSLKPSTVDPLPEGFDDQASFYFIPESHRAAWTEHSATAPGRIPRAVSQNIAVLELSAKHRAERREDERAREAARAGTRSHRPLTDSSADEEQDEPLSGFALTDALLGPYARPLWAGDSIDRLVDDLLEQEPTRYESMARFTITAAHVKHHAERHAKRVRAEEAARSVYTCPVCGAVEAGAPMARPLAPVEVVNWVSPSTLTPRGLPVPTLLACAKCHLVAAEIYAEAVRVERTRDGETRRVVVARALGMEAR
ncbi:hypothetical protein [Pseudolysinimonas sp.]|uniref:hypothetical protein n=1 Tax=Pseudolysinimonas sp. TaxID=2680009 RepID=UPI0037837FC4